MLLPLPAPVSRSPLPGWLSLFFQTASGVLAARSVTGQARGEDGASIHGKEAEAIGSVSLLRRPLDRRF
ncbi:MAG: hypothetical protein RLZZ440_1827 [Planctomycetota bacterium]